MAGSPPLDAARLLGHTTVVVQLLVGAGSSSSGGAQQVAATVSGEGSALVHRAGEAGPMNFFLRLAFAFVVGVVVVVVVRRLP